MEFDEKVRLAEAAAKCGLVESAEFALVVMAYAESEGLHPAAGLREYKAVNGKPSLSAESMLARFQRSGGAVIWERLDDTSAVGVFRYGDTEARIEWDLDRARRAGLVNDRGSRPSMWKLYPRAMLRSRVVSEGVRTVFPGLVLGVYTPEEQEQIEEERAAHPVKQAKPEAKPEAAEEPKPKQKAERNAEQKVLNTLRVYDQERFEKNLPVWVDMYRTGKLTEERLLALVASKGDTFSAEQMEKIKAAFAEPFMSGAEFKRLRSSLVRELATGDAGTLDKVIDRCKADGKPMTEKQIEELITAAAELDEIAAGEANGNV